MGSSLVERAPPSLASGGSDAAAHGAASSASTGMHAAMSAASDQVQGALSTLSTNLSATLGSAGSVALAWSASGAAALEHGAQTLEKWRVELIAEVAVRAAAAVSAAAAALESVRAANAPDMPAPPARAVALPAALPAAAVAPPDAPLPVAPPPAAKAKAKAAQAADIAAEQAACNVAGDALEAREVGAGTPFVPEEAEELAGAIAQSDGLMLAKMRRQSSRRGSPQISPSQPSSLPSSLPSSQPSPQPSSLPSPQPSAQPSSPFSPSRGESVPGLYAQLTSGRYRGHYRRQACGSSEGGDASDSSGGRSTPINRLMSLDAVFTPPPPRAHTPGSAGPEALGAVLGTIYGEGEDGDGAFAVSGSVWPTGKMRFTRTRPKLAAEGHATAAAAAPGAAAEAVVFEGIYFGGKLAGRFKEPLADGTLAEYAFVLRLAAEGDGEDVSA